LQFSEEETMSIIALMRKRQELCDRDEYERVEAMIVSINNEQDRKKQEALEVLFLQGLPKWCPETQCRAEHMAGIRG
jgi:hypothetical protein